VKTIVLSDHAADQLRTREAERQSRYEAGMQAYEGRLQARQKRIDEGRARRRAACEQKRYLWAMGYALVVVSHRLKKLMESHGRPVKELPGLEDHIWQQGQEGEDGLAEFLAQTLDDQYILIKGYKNRRGEIDQILVGPNGIFAAEVKNCKGTIYCRGDVWTRDKTDNWGNQVLFGEPIVDRGGRSPSRQVNESADLLEAFLKKTMPSCKVHRNIIFTNGDADLGDLQDLTVDGAFLMRNWKPQGMLRESTSWLTAREVEVAIHQIERDHRYHQERRHARSASHPGRAA
jgi:hypothetical protein